MKRLETEALEHESQYLRLLVYGEPGTGKTWFGASAALDPLTAPAMFLEYRAQISSLRSNPDFLAAMDAGDLVILQLEKYSELNYVYTWLKNGHGSNATFDDLFKEAPKTVVIDSLTELQRTEVMRIAGNPQDKFLSAVDTPEIQHWGSILNQFTLLANLFYKLPMHVIFVGLEDVDYGPRNVGEAPPIQGYRLALQGSSQRQFPAYALTLMRLDRLPPGADGHCMGYTRARRAKTKEQTGMLPAKLPNPSVPILAKYLAAKREPSAPEEEEVSDG